MRRVHLGIAGLGRLGMHHAENLAGRIPSVDLVRVVDVRPDVARGTGERLGVAWASDFSALLEDPRIDGVVIATPTATHAGMIRQAANAGKHIFCEKPISFDPGSSREAIEAARAAGVKLQIGFHRRYDPDWVAAMERISAGELGDVHLFRTSLRDMRPPGIDYIRTSGGFFVDVTIHDFDAARWMVGEIDEVSATGAALADPEIASVGDIDTALVTLRFASGALGVIDNSRGAGYGYECSTEVMGSQATARIGHHRRTGVEWLTPGRASVDWVTDFVQRYPLAFLRELEDFALAVGDDRPVRVTGEDALAALVLCEAATRSLQAGGPVRLLHERRASGTFYRVDGAPAA